MTNPLLEKLRDALSAIFPVKRVNEVLFHYEALRREILRDRYEGYESCLVNGGKFAEAVLKCLRYLRNGDDLDTLPGKGVEDEIEQLRTFKSTTSLGDIQRLLIPRTLRVIYDHRNKRGGAHNNSFDPIRMDCNLVVAMASWVMEEFTRLYLTNDPIAAQTLVNNLLVKEIPFVEEIDGEYIVANPELPARVQLEFLLYRHHPNRCAIRDLVYWLRHNQSEENVRVSLRNLKLKNLAHENDTGWTLTRGGLQKAEEEIMKLNHETSRINDHSGPKSKGAKNGR